MTVKMLLKLYEVRGKNPAVLNEWVKIENYLPFTEKDALVKDVLRSTFEYRDENGGLKSYSAVRSKVFTEKILASYTNIEVDSQTYDSLAEAGILLPILRLIGDEYEMCSKMLGAYLEDIINGFVTLEDL